MFREKPMEQNQEKIERKIETTAEEILSLKKDGKFNSVECSALKTKLADHAWRWAEIVFGRAKISNASEEIMKCVRWSLENFDEAKISNFINYLSVAMKNEINRANEKQQVFEASAIDFPNKKKRKLRQMIRFAEQYGKDICDQTVQEKLCQFFGATKEEIEDLLNLRKRAETVGEKTEDRDGEEISLFDSAVFSLWKQTAKSELEIH